MTNESKPDLTPAEARAEIEAFMGEGWTVDAHAPNDPCLAGVRAWWHSDALVGLHSDATTLRAAVSALKQAWRDAVRPWMQKADEQAFAEGCAYEKHRKQRTTQGERISRVLKESDHEV